MKVSKLIVLFFVFLLVGIRIVDAEVTEFNIKPENPIKGDTVRIYGTASPNENVKIDISFEKVVPVQNGEYVFSVNDVKIPEGKNKFTVTAYGCDNLKVSVKILFNLVWVTLSSEASNGVATISKSNVPAGTYDVVIHGKSSQSSVKLKITATGYIKADENGKFSYSYDTSSIPPGVFVISVSGLKKVITLAESTSSSSGGGGSSVPISTPILTITPTVSPTPTATPTTPTQTPTSITTIPTQTQTPTPTETPTMATTTITPEQTSTPEQTPTPTHTPVQTPTTTVSNTQNETNKANQAQNASQSTRIPGFEFITVITSSILAVFIYKRLKY